MTWKLPQVKQCASCPWKQGSKLSDIPNYSSELHQNLVDTIAVPGELNLDEPLKIMACHHSTEGDDRHCIGWLHNQQGIGNNIGVRLRLRFCENIDQVELDGPQKETFEETFE
ncbi:DUF6283 family protein [Chroococcidiopsis sp.]|uniref:DUF6283 family protein n=1 Tax=Chroococcidiopsis sp. TaxID=3088168 RepID=UPI003F3CBC5F